MSNENRNKLGDTTHNFIETNEQKRFWAYHEQLYSITWNSIDEMNSFFQNTHSIAAYS